MPQAELVPHLSPGNSAPFVLSKARTNNNGLHHFVSLVGRCPSCFWHHFYQCILSTATLKSLFFFGDILSRKLQDGVWKSQVSDTEKWTQKLKILKILLALPKIVCATPNPHRIVCSVPNPHRIGCAPQKQFQKPHFFSFTLSENKKSLILLELQGCSTCRSNSHHLGWNIFKSLSCIKADSRGQVRHCWWNFSFSQFIYRSSFSDSSNYSDFLMYRI